MTVPFIEEEIREQPRVLERVLRTTRAEIDEVALSRRWKCLHLVGCGDMYFSALTAAWLATVSGPRPGVRVAAWRSMDLRWLGKRLGEDDLVVAASVSGRTPRTIEAARAARRASARVVGVTDNAQSRLAEEVDVLVVLGTSPPEKLAAGSYPGYHHAVAQTKTFTATLLVEILLATIAGGGRASALEGIPGRVAALLPTLSESIAAGTRDWFAGRERVAILASGPHLPLGLYGAAKLTEYAVPAHAQCLEEFNHLEMFLADDRTLVVVVAPDSESIGRAVELTGPWERLGVRSLVIGGGKSWPGERTARVELPAGEDPHALAFELALAMQLLAYRGAAALGRDPDAWLGGVRTELVQGVSSEVIRGSRISDDDS